MKNRSKLELLEWALCRPPLLRTLGWVLMLVATAFVLFVFFVFDEQRLPMSEPVVYDFNSEWIMTDGDGNTVSLDELPYAGTSGPGEEIVLENTIPEDCYGLTLAFLSADKTVEVEVDGRTVYTFGMSDDLLFGKSPGSMINFVDLPIVMNDPTVRITFKSSYADYASYISTFVLGRKGDVVNSIFVNQLPSLIMFVIVIGIGILMLVLAAMRAVGRNYTYGVEFLGMFFFSFSFVMLIETKVLPIFLGQPVLFSVQMFITLMISPVFYLLYYQKRFKDLKNPFLTLTLWASMLNMVVQLVLQAFNVADFMEMRFVVYTLVVLGILACIFQIVLAVRREMIVGNIWEVIGALVAAGTGFADFIRLSQIKVGDLCMFSRYGIAFYGVCMVYVHVRIIVREDSFLLEENARLMGQALDYERARVKEMEQEKTRAEAQNQAKSRFLANMSHEIRTPINVIIGFNTMIRREARNAQIKEYADNVDNSAHNLLALINDVLDFSKIESGALSIVEAEYDFASFVNDICIIAQERSRQKHLDFILENDPEIPEKVYGDEARVRQIVTNLLTNAVKYTPSGSVSLSFEKKDFRIDDKGRDIFTLKVIVRDTGIGIKSENLDKIFGSFERLDIEKHKNIEGTGLGLNISRTLARAMGGDIEVRSTYGRGSEFTAYIPQVIHSEETVGDIAGRFAEETRARFDQIYRAKVFAPDARILYVDDLDMNLKVFCGLLKDTGMIIDTAAGGEEALGLMEKNHYDIVFVDDMMPGMNGREVLVRALKRRSDGKYPNSDTPILVVTANAMAGSREEYLALGFSDYISKPMRDDELENMIVKYLPAELNKGRIESFDAAAGGEPDALAGDRAAAEGEAGDVFVEDGLSGGSGVDGDESAHDTAEEDDETVVGTEIHGKYGKVPAFSQKWVVRSFAALMLLVAFFGLASYSGSYKDYSLTASEGGVELEWALVTVDGVENNITFPQKCGSDGEATLTATIPTGKFKGKLYIYSDMQDMTVDIDGERVYTYVYDEKSVFNVDYPPRAWISVPVDDEQEEVSVEIHLISRVSENSEVVGVFYGNKFDFAYMVISQNMMTVLGVIVLALAALGLALKYVFAGVEKDQRRGVLYNAIMMILLAGALLCQSDLKQFVFDNVLFARNLGYFMLMLVPVAYLVCVDVMTSYRFAMLCRGYAFVVMAIDFCAIIATALSNGEVRLLDVLPLIYIIYAVMFVLSIYMFAMFRKKDRELFKSRAIFFYVTLGAFLLCLADLLVYFIRGYSFMGWHVSLAGFIYGMGIFVAHECEIKDLVTRDRKRAMAVRNANRMTTDIAVDMRNLLASMLTLDELILKEEKDVVIQSYAQSIRSVGIEMMDVINKTVGQVHDSDKSLGDLGDETGAIINIDTGTEAYDSGMIDDNGDSEPAEAERVLSDEDKRLVAIRDIPGMDIKSGIDYCGGDKSFYLGIVAEYLKVDRAADIERTRSEGDGDNYTLYVHSLKSTSYSIGARELGDDAKNMEIASSEGDKDYIDSHHEDLVGKYRRLREGLERAMEGYEEGDCNV
ncbi:MAG: response regulator [Eubacterium sp.]|nr:response regulator [Eubacterium sp.]